MSLFKLPTDRVLKIVLLLAIALRLCGMVLNTEANDDHMSVIRVIAFQHRIPADSEFWQAYQPKLFHGTVAAVFNVLPELPDRVLVRVAQAISCTAGVLTLFLLLDFIGRLDVSTRVRQLSFALAALNPKMIAVSIQVTNDAFVCLFGTLAFYAGYRWFKDGQRRHFWIMTAGAALTGISKGNGLAVLLAIGACFAAAWLWKPWPRARTAGLALVFAAITLTIVTFGGQYWQRYRDTGNPFTINEAYMPPPKFMEETFVRRPGVTSVVNSFLTFRLGAMLAEPQITNETDVYPPHRTSFWSVIYGSMHTIHYDYFPPTWQTHNAIVRGLLRLIFLLALLPTGMLIYGVWSACREQLRAITRRSAEVDPARLLVTLGAAGYTAFIAVFAYHERDFGSMKPIYLFPAALPMLYCCALGLQRLTSGRHRWLGPAVLATSTALVVASTLDVFALMAQLTALRLHLH